MFLALAFVCSAGPEFVVENKCPPAFTVVNKCPAPRAKPIPASKNGFNCGAGFCSAQNGKGCQATGHACPNSSGGQCVCGPKPSAVAPKQSVGYTLTSSFQSCPTGS